MTKSLRLLNNKLWNAIHNTLKNNWFKLYSLQNSRNPNKNFKLLSLNNTNINSALERLQIHVGYISSTISQIQF